MSTDAVDTLTILIIDADEENTLANSFNRRLGEPFVRGDDKAFFRAVRASNIADSCKIIADQKVVVAVVVITSAEDMRHIVPALQEKGIRVFLTHKSPEKFRGLSRELGVTTIKSSTDPTMLIVQISHQAFLALQHPPT